MRKQDWRGPQRGCFALLEQRRANCAARPAYARVGLVVAACMLLPLATAGAQNIATLPPPRATAVSFWSRPSAATATRGRSGRFQVAASSLLDRLPRVGAGQYAEVLAKAKRRGDSGRADVAWIELFYGSPQAKAQAYKALQKIPGSETPEMAFVRFVAAYSHGSDRAMLQGALRLTRLAPDDVATELAVRALSGQLENQGRELLDAVPSLEHALREPLADPVTSYMLGRSVLAAVDAPGMALTQAEAQQMAGRLRNWQLWGPFGDLANLAFDRAFAIENTIAASYSADAETDAEGRTPQAFTSSGNGVHFPLNWDVQGVDYAISYVHVARPARVLLRMYTPASTVLAINGEEVIRNDRRASYRAATVAAAVELAAGWNRVVVKLGGEADRDFDLMLRAAPGTTLEDAAELPAGAKLAGAPRLLPPPTTLAGWSRQRLSAHPHDAVALWVDGLRLQQDEDPEGAREALQQAAKLAPNAGVVWLDLATCYGNLTDASQSWTASQMERAAQQALKVAPAALRAYDRLGQVYQSEGKTTQAAEQFAHCSDKGYADCDWSAFHLAAGKGWRPEAETALEHALAESGSDWSGIVSGLEFYASMGEAAPTAEWERVLRTDPRAAAALGAYQLRHGDAAGAARSLATAIQQEPSSAALRREHIEALMESGQLRAAALAAQADVAAMPHDWRLAAVADEVALRQGAAAGLAALRRTQTHHDRLRQEADFLAGDRFWAPWYHSATDVIAHAPDASEYPSASNLLVFDQMVNRINPDATQDQYIHQIYKVLNAAGVEQIGEVTTIPANADLIRLQTIKANGRRVLPESIRNLADVTMPDLEPGDYIEIEFVQHMEVSNIIPGTLDDREFFVFNSSKQPYNYSQYVVLTPPGFPLLVDQERFPGAPTTRTQPDGYTARTWLVQRTRILVTEPHMPPEDTLVPKVWVSSPRQWSELSRYYADNMFAVRRTTAEMRAQAATLAAGQSTAVAKANAIFNWVVANIQPGPGGILSPARQYFTDHSGNRVAVFLALLSAVQVHYKLVMARPVTDNSSLKIPSMFQFQYPLVHVAAGADAANPASGWYDLNGNFGRLDYVAPGVRGGLAFVAEAAGTSSFIHVPAFDSPLDALVVNVTGQVNDAGDATLHLQMEFRGPGGEQVRQELSTLPDSSLPQVYQQVLLGTYPNGTATHGEIENRTDKDKPLIFAIDATVPGFVHTDGGSAWDIEHLTGAVGVLRRYAPLPVRSLPLLIPGDSFEQTSVKITLPARFGAPNLPAPAHLDNTFGRFSSNFAQQGNTLEFHRTLFLKANRIEPAQYGNFRTFAEAVDTQDRLRLTGRVQ
ncbi:MAG: DUF3857 domain-containing protein [Terriglobales bacterium]